MTAAVEGGLVRAGSLNFWVERSGAGPPVLLITGLGYASWCWSTLRRRLGQEFALIAFDNRGTGRSDKPPGPYSMPLMADDAAAVLDATGAGEAHVLGHSMGGYIALTLALRHPRKVRSLTLVGTSPGGPETHPVPEETLNVWKLAGSLPPHDYARRSMPQSFAPGWTGRHPAEFERLLSERLQFPTPAPSWLAQYEACVEFVGRGVDVGGIDVPALVIHGGQDRVVPLHNGALLARKLPRARFVSLPDSGHLPFFEEPDRFAELVRTHLEGRVP